MRRWGRQAWMLGLTGALALLGRFAAALWPTWRGGSLTVHATIAGLVGGVALLSAALILALAEERRCTAWARWGSSALLTMGCLELFHACTTALAPFVAYRSLANALGGLLMACVWLPRPPRWTPFAALAIAGFVGVAVGLVPGLLPPMVVGGDDFTGTAKALNVAGGLGFLGAMLWFRRSTQIEDVLLSAVCMLFGAAAMSLPNSHPWSADWWVWHGLRLAGAAIGAGYLLAMHRGLARQARAALETRETFLHMASHELRTPLVPLVLRLQLLRRDVERGKMPTTVVVDKALRSVELIAALVERLLRVMTVESQASTYGAQISLTTIVREAVETYQLVSKRHELRLASPTPELTVFGDRPSLAVVIATLLQNAIKYSPHGGPVTVTLRRAGLVAELAVQDAGIGIPAADLPRVFDKFFRASNGSSHQLAGLGLGLYTIHSIVRRHGGRIRAHSDLGVGTAFIVTLPLAAEVAAAGAALE